MTNTQTKAKKFRPLKDLGKEDLIQIALNEKGTISNCYHLFHNFSSTNAWLLAIQQVDKGLDVTPVMCTTDWVKAGIISEETRQRHYYDRMYARRVGTYKKKDKYTGELILDDNGEPIEEKCYPLTKSYLSYSQFKKSELLKEFKPNYTVDFKQVLNVMGLTEIKYGLTDGNCQGYCLPNDKKLAINPLAENAQKTMLHEIAHCLLHASDGMTIDNKWLDQSIKEAEAECTAYVCSVMLGDTDEQHLSHSRGYIQAWLGKNEFKPVNSKRVCKAVDIIMKAIANYKDKYDNKEFAKDLKALKAIK